MRTKRIDLAEPAVIGPPEPAPGCDVCGALFRQWTRASNARGPEYDPSRAVDLAVEIRRHPHEGKKVGA